jgi:transposase
VTVPLRDDFDAAGVRALAAQCDNVNQARRLLSIAAIYDGMNRRDAARVGGMDRKTLRDWVHRFNAHGPDGLRDGKAKGASPKLTPAQLRELAAVVESGPDPLSDGVARWRCADLKAWIEKRFGVVYHDRSVARLLKQLGLGHITHGPRRPKREAAAMMRVEGTPILSWRRHQFNRRTMS